MTDLCTLADVKLAVGIPSATSTSDALITALIPAVSKAITSRYQHDFAPIASATHRFQVKNRRVGLEPYDLRTATTVTLNPEATGTVLVAGTDYDLLPSGGTSTMGTYTELLLSNYLTVNSSSLRSFGYANLDIAGAWGPAAIPVDVARAAAITAAAWLDKGADQIAGYDSTTRPDGSTFAASWAIPIAAHRIMQAYERFSWYVA
jgi:hypothetical protein